LNAAPVIATAKLNDVDPKTWLADVFAIAGTAVDSL